MLNDVARNQAYLCAIQKAIGYVLEHNINHTSSSKTPPNQNPSLEQKEDWAIVDVGCGTGLWGMVVSQIVNSINRQPPPPISIQSIDMSPFMVLLAQQIVRDNLPIIKETRPRVIEQHSTDMLFPKIRMHVYELLEHGLLGEGWLPTMRQFWNQQQDFWHSTASKPIVIPSCASVFAHVVQCGESRSFGWIHDCCGPHVYKSDQNDFELAFFSHNTDQAWMAADDVVLPVHATQLLKQNALQILSSESVPLMDISVENPLPDESTTNKSGPTKHKRTITVAKDGFVHAIMVGWKLHLLPSWIEGYYDEAYTITNSWTESREDQEVGSKVLFQDHWCPCLHPVENPRMFRRGDTCTLESWHDDERIYVRLLNDDNESLKRPRLLHHKPPSRIAALTPLRLRQLNDTTRLATLERGLKDTIASMTKDSRSSQTSWTVLDVSDFALGGLLAAHLLPKSHHPRQSTTTIFSMEGSSQGPFLTSQSAQANKWNGVQFQVLQCHPESLQPSIFWETNSVEGSSKTDHPFVDMLVAEPYFEMTEQWPLISALNLYNIVQRLKQVEVIASNETRIVPSRARIMAVPIESRDIYSAYQPVGDEEHKILGLDHSFLNNQRGTLVNGSFTLTLPMWQYSYKTLGSPVEITTLDYECSSQQTHLQGSMSIPLIGNALCHGLMIWVDYDLSKGLNNNVLSTNAEYEHQLFHMLEKPFHCRNNGSVLECSFQLNGNSANADKPIQFGLAAKEMS